MVGFVNSVFGLNGIEGGRGCYSCRRSGLARVQLSGVKLPGFGDVSVVDDGYVVDPEALRDRAKGLVGEVVVVKYGGAAMASEELKAKVVGDVALLRSFGVNVVLVHGGGPAVNVMLKRLNIEAVFRNGLRVTDEQTMEVVEMVLAGKVNKDLVSLINQCGSKAVGICGKDAKMIVAKQKNPDLGLVGEVTSVDSTLINTLISGGFIPVVSSIATSDDGTAYNINADTLAGDIASELKARKLIMMTDVPGVMKDPKEIGTLYSSLTYGQTQELISEGIISGGMIPKVQCCTDALKAQVKETHIVDGRRPHSLLLELFEEQGIGTMITQ
eukprot:CAMPEP_0113955538 /NCGR_PEP_ID=MMETSP0011_2-20120614/1410_1 /TAXON_ID=101924 /ORGANISM="Rhodosorus marinus" /LENGTH=327 /DNA_ID=CAMNT_0000965281 /DNA_START=77 /DNA_END=1060 /DNA_ORIENTATION=- /assembly_acc=CAM_ASM_000156